MHLHPQPPAPTLAGTLSRLSGLILCLAALYTAPKGAELGYALFGALGLLAGFFVGTVLDLAGGKHA